MKTETLEMIIEELASALNAERWINESQREKIVRLEEEIGVLKGLLDSRCEGCAGRAAMTEGDNG